MTQIPFAEVETWIFRDALPFWAERGVDHEYGGFLEELSPLGEPTNCAFKRVRTMCRQTYAFSHGALMGFAPGAALSQMGFEFLEQHARLENGGWAKTLGRKGEVRDATADLYDLAFVVFALAWRYRLSQDPHVLKRLHETMDFIRQNMRAAEGFVAQLPDDGVRVQNPHMHLLEAQLAAFDATQDEAFLDQARELVGLFRRRFFDGRTLGERFNANWVRDGEQEIEPGHQFEWAWILSQYGKHTKEDLSREAVALVEFGEKFGVHAASRAVLDAVTEDGRPLKETSRSWTSTERIKGWVALHEMGCADGREPITQSVRLLLDRYFAQSLPGAWADKFDLDGRQLSQAVPASILYHILLAFTEVARIRPSFQSGK